MEPVGAGFALGLLRQPEKLQCGASRPLDEPGVHSVVADVEETDVDRGPGESGPDAGGIGTVTQVSDVDHRNLGCVDWVGPRRNSHEFLSNKFGVRFATENVRRCRTDEIGRSADD